MTRESTVESSLTAACRMRGWMCLKWSPDGVLGVPDRIILAPSGRMFLVEVKRPGGRPRASQTAFASRLARLGHTVAVYDGTEPPGRFLDRLTHERPDNPNHFKENQ